MDDKTIPCRFKHREGKRIGKRTKEIKPRDRGLRNYRDDLT